MKSRKRAFVAILLALVVTIFCGFGAAGAYDLSISMNDDQGGSLNINYEISNPGASPMTFTCQCCFDSYHPYLQGAMINGCLDMDYTTDYLGQNFTIIVTGGPVVYSFAGGGSYQVSYDNFTIVSNGYSFSISGHIIVDGTPLDISGWNGNPMWLFF